MQREIRHIHAECQILYRQTVQNYQAAEVAAVRWAIVLVTLTRCWGSPAWQVDLPKDPSFSENGPPPKHASFSQLPTSPHGASPHTGSEKAGEKALEHQPSGARACAPMPTACRVALWLCLHGSTLAEAGSAATAWSSSVLSDVVLTLRLA